MKSSVWHIGAQSKVVTLQRRGLPGYALVTALSFSSGTEAFSVCKLALRADKVHSHGTPVEPHSVTWAGQGLSVPLHGRGN